MEFHVLVFQKTTVSLLVLDVSDGVWLSTSRVDRLGGDVVSMSDNS
jgi:hypothetical protein